MLTNDITPVVTGTAEAGSLLTIAVGGATYNTSAAADGSWTLDTGSAPVASGVFNPDVNGANEIVATSSDAAGNISSADASTNEIIIDTTLPIDSINSAPIAAMANEAIYTVGGACIAGDNDVAVSIGGVSPGQNVSCSSNAWTAMFDVSGIADGASAIMVNASQTDAATNFGNATVSVAKE